MAGDSPDETALRRSDLSLVLNELSLFRGLDYALLREIAHEAQWMSLPGGATLFNAGEPADALYVVLSGCLGAFSPDDRDRRRFWGRIVAGDTVGEMGLISGRPRNAHVVALPGAEEIAEQAAEALSAAGRDVLLDDRDQRAGEKFADADLVGCPVRVTAGRKSLEDGKVDVRDRASGGEKRLDVAELGKEA